MRRHALIIALLLTAFTAAGQITILPPVELKLSVGFASLASDGNRLIVDYCPHDPSLPQDSGELREWNGVEWQKLPGSSAGCRWPDLAVSGDFIITTGQDDSGYAQYSTNITHYPAWSGVTWSGLHKQFYPRAAIAGGDAYISFDQISGHLSDEGAWVHNVSCGAACWNLTGLYRPFDSLSSWAVGPVSMAGDASGVYIAFASVNQGCINVYHLLPNDAGGWVGGCFYYDGNAGSPEVTTFNGQPAVSFVENGTGLVIGRWNGQQWMVIGTGRAPAGRKFGTCRIEGSNGRLWVASQLDRAPQGAAVDWYENGEWNSAGDPLAGLGTQAAFTDLAIYQGEPYLTVFDPALKIVRLSTDEPPVRRRAVRR